jgi:hypothetical protein
VSAGPPPKKRLGVLVDGAPLPEEDAHALWERFSAWMEEHRGDLAGFALQEGFVSIHPGVDGDRPVLRASKTAAQRPYASVRAEPDPPPVRSARIDHGRGRSGGSPARQGGPSSPDRRRGNTTDLAKKPPK